MTARLRAAARRSAAFSAALSFVLPGLGQGMSGKLLRGLGLAAPILVLIGVAIMALGQGRLRLLGLVIQPQVMIALLVLDAALLMYRTAAIVDAYLHAVRLHPVVRDRRRQATSVAVLAALLVATVSMHAALGFVGVKSYVAFERIFDPNGPNGGIGALPSSSATPASGTQGHPTATPAPTPPPPPPWSSDGRLNVLLVGGDAGPGRWSLRTDTMILASVEIATGRAAFFGIPRNLINVPLPPESARAFKCRCFPDLLNGLYVYAGQHPESFPGGDARGYLALQGAVGQLTGLRVDGTIVVDLNGFARLVNAFGGIDIRVPYAIYDPSYPLEDGSRDVVLRIRAGQQHMNGHLALAYARSRHQDDDYHRMARQQLVLLAIRRAVNPCTVIPRLPELIDIAGQSLWTDFKVKDLPDLLALAQRVDTSHIALYAFNPPGIPEYLTRSGVAKVQAMVARAFTAGASAIPSASGAATPAATSPDSGC